MCEPGRHVKLCTCDAGADLPRPRWRIARQTARDAWRNTKSLAAVGGSVFPPLETRLLIDLVRRDVNRPDAFDIDPQAREGDVLTLEFETETTVFLRRGDRWEENGPIGTTSSVVRLRGSIRTTP